VIFVFVCKVALTVASLNIPQNIFFADITKIALESFVNQTRESLGLTPLVINEKLNEAASLKAENMVQNQYFDHTSPNGITPWFWFSKAGYNYKYAGENLAVGFFDSKEVYEAWLDSPTHKANIVNPNYTEMGTAILKGFGQDNSIIVVQTFGSQKVAKHPAPATNNTNTAVAPENITEKSKEPAQEYTSNQVLSQFIEPKNFIGYEGGKSVSDLQAKVLNYVLYDNQLLQNIIYAMLFAVLASVAALLIFAIYPSLSQIDLQVPKKIKVALILRSVILIVLLSGAALFNSDILSAIFPHQIII